jgi:hypothetical protein
VLVKEAVDGGIVQLDSLLDTSCIFAKVLLRKSVAIDGSENDDCDYLILLVHVPQ